MNKASFIKLKIAFRSCLAACADWGEPTNPQERPFSLHHIKEAAMAKILDAKGWEDLIPVLVDLEKSLVDYINRSLKDIEPLIFAQGGTKTLATSRELFHHLIEVDKIIGGFYFYLSLFADEIIKDIRENHLRNPDPFLNVVAQMYDRFRPFPIPVVDNVEVGKTLNNQIQNILFILFLKTHYQNSDTIKRLVTNLTQVLSEKDFRIGLCTGFHNNEQSWVVSPINRNCFAGKVEDTGAIIDPHAEAICASINTLAVTHGFKPIDPQFYSKQYSRQPGQGCPSNMDFRILFPGKFVPGSNEWNAYKIELAENLELFSIQLCAGSFMIAENNTIGYLPWFSTMLHEFIHILHNARGENRGNSDDDPVKEDWKSLEEFWTTVGGGELTEHGVSESIGYPIRLPYGQAIFRLPEVQMSNTDISSIHIPLNRLFAHFENVAHDHDVVHLKE